MNQVASIFEPRKAFEVDKKTGEAKQVDYISPVITKEYDKYYIKRTIKFVPVPISEGSEDYILEMKVIDDKEDIAYVINSQAINVGLEAMLDRFDKTKDPSVLPQPVNATDEIVDFTKLPQDNAEYFEYIHGLAAAFEKLPIELRKDMTAEDFVRNITQKQVDDYLASLKPEVKENKNE